MTTPATTPSPTLRQYDISARSTDTFGRVLCTARDHHFIVDRHPDDPRILLAAGFSGRGFKFSIGIGRLLADLAVTPAGTYASPFWVEAYRLR